jgi:hypothetical protein
MKGTLIPRVEYKKRVGALNVLLLKETYQDAWSILCEGRIAIDEDTPLTFNPLLQNHLDMVRQKAVSRTRISVPKQK